jgi:hypothetical protein
MRPVSFIINELDSITGAGEVDIARDKISELSIQISLNILLLFIYY